MRMAGYRVFAAGLLAFLGFGGAALACEEYVNIPAQELKEYRDKLIDQQADPLDRLFAFQQLVCSSNPVMRAYAVREGMRSASDPMVRQQILFDSMMQKPRLSIELTAAADAPKGDKAFVKDVSSIWALEIVYRSSKEGCLSFNYRDRCGAQNSAFIRGDRVSLAMGTAIGEFYLADSGELIGYVRVRDNRDYARIPAVIKLD